MEINEVINKSIQSTNDLLGGNGNYNLVIAMEKWIRATNIKSFKG